MDMDVTHMSIIMTKTRIATSPQHSKAKTKTRKRHRSDGQRMKAAANVVKQWEGHGGECCHAAVSPGPRPYFAVLSSAYLVYSGSTSSSWGWQSGRPAVRRASWRGCWRGRPRTSSSARPASPCPRCDASSATQTWRTAGSGGRGAVIAHCYLVWPQYNQPQSPLSPTPPPQNLLQIHFAALIAFLHTLGISSIFQLLK
jgi:hypothetical protein